MHNESDPLLHTKPLADPVRIITLLMLAGGVLIGVITGILYAAAFGIYGVLMGVAMALMVVSYALLIGPVGRPNAIYLRAFRTDRSTAKLRAELAAILGPGYRLSGIRPPQKKTSIFLRFLVPGLVALRYAGSKFMELEAGDDWMARLWKTYQTTRLVFIDVRDVTIHVHYEIQMTMATMGAERCIFVIGPGRSSEEWRAVVAAIAGPQYDPAAFKLLDASEERIRNRQMQADLQGILNSLPSGAPGATDRGRHFILEHVPADLLVKSRRTSPMNVLSAVLAVVLSLAFSFYAGKQHPFLLLPIIILGLVVTLKAMFLAVGRIARLARAGHRGAAVRVGFLLFAACLPFVISVVSITVAIPALKKSRQHADATAALSSLHTLTSAEMMYYSTYDEYACQLSQLGGNPQLGQPTAQAAQLIGDDLASGKKFGYTFTFSKCQKTSTNGHDQVTDFEINAVPDNPEGQRGFCVDSSAEIRVDPNGGTNCTKSFE